MSTILIAIDPGKNAGVAVFKDGKLIHNTYIVNKSYVPFNEFMDNIMVEVNIHKTKHDVFRMVVEKTFFKFGSANVPHLKTLGVLEYFYNCAFIAPTSVKKLVTGSGRASKEEVLNAVFCKLSKYEMNSLIHDREDTVDAVAIGLAFLKQLEELND